MFIRSMYYIFIFFLMIRRPPRSTRTHTLSLHDALPIYGINRDSAAQLNELAVQLLRKMVNVTFWRVMEPLPWVWTWSCSDYPKESLFGSVGFIRSDEHTSELQSLMRISHAVFCVTTTPLKHHLPLDTIANRKPTE